MEGLDRCAQCGHLIWTDTGRHVGRIVVTCAHCGRHHEVAAIHLCPGSLEQHALEERP